MWKTIVEYIQTGIKMIYTKLKTETTMIKMIKETWNIRYMYFVLQLRQQVEEKDQLDQETFEV